MIVNKNFIEFNISIVVLSLNLDLCVHFRKCLLVVVVAYNE